MREAIKWIVEAANVEGAAERRIRQSFNGLINALVEGDYERLARLAERCYRILVTAGCDHAEAEAVMRYLLNKGSASAPTELRQRWAAPLASALPKPLPAGEQTEAEQAEAEQPQA